MTRTHGFLRSDGGMTVVELMVAMTLLAVATVAIFGAVSSIYRGHNFTTEDSDALAALRTAMDRLAKETRQARRIYPDSTATKLHFWVDYDRDYREDADEKIVWQLTATGGKAQLTRTTEASGARVWVVARDLVLADAFAYGPGTPQDTTMVEMSFGADTQPGSLAPARSLATQVRLRNVTQ